MQALHARKLQLKALACIMQGLHACTKRSDLVLGKCEQIIDYVVQVQYLPGWSVGLH